MTIEFPQPPSGPIVVGAPRAEIVAADVRRALAEDIGDGDVSAALIDATARGEADVIARESLVLAGQAWFDACLSLLDPTSTVTWRFRDGERIAGARPELHDSRQLSGNQRRPQLSAIGVSDCARGAGGIRKLDGREVSCSADGIQRDRGDAGEVCSNEHLQPSDVVRR